MARLLFVAQPTSGGVAAVVAQQVEWAIERGHEVTVACPSGQRGTLADAVVDLGARHISIDMRRAPALLDIVHAWSLRRQIARADLVSLHSSKAGGLGRLAAKSLRRKAPPVVFTPHAWSWLIGGPARGLYRAAEKTLARWTDLIVAVGPGEAAAGRAAIGRQVPIQVIVNGVDTRNFTPAGPKAPRSSDPLIVCVGRLSRQKGQDTAIRALAEMSNRSAILRLVGPGEHHALEQLALDLDVATRVEFVGPVADVRPHLRASDIVLLPSRWDGMSLSLLEAMASGSAIIATDVAGVEALGQAGVVVPPEDISAMTAALERLVSDSAQRTTLGSAARERVQEYDLSITKVATLELWEWLLDSGPSATWNTAKLVN